MDYDDQEEPIDDQEEEDDGQEEELLQQQMQAAKAKQMKAEEKVLKNKLRAAMVRVAKGSIALNADEQKTIKKAKKHKSLKKEILALYTLIAANKVKLAMKTMSTAPSWYYVAIGALIIVLIICIVCIVASIMPWLFPDDGGGSQVNSLFGITGNDFYGARMIYTDQEQAAINMVEDYVELVENGIDEVQTIPSVSSGDVTLQINIVLPEEDFDYSSFNEADFQSNYSILYSIIFDVAKEVYKADNSTDYSGSSLVECAEGILYFGYGEDAMLEVPQIVIDSILANYSIVEGDGENVESEITSKLEELYSHEKYKVRTEKLFVKDYIISGDERIQNVAKENYVAFIFMPKKSVTFTKFSFSVGNADLSEFTIELYNNGNEVKINKDNFNFADNDSGSSVDSFMYESGVFTNESASVFTDIDQSNLSALSEGLSLFDVVQNVEDYSIYLETASGEDGKQYYTIKTNGVVVEMSNKEAFSFVEFETVWKAAS